MPRTVTSSGAHQLAQAVYSGASSGGAQRPTASASTSQSQIQILLPYTLVRSDQQSNGGSWSALDVATGKITWQTADPTPGTRDRGSVSVANCAMYACG